MLSGQQSKKAKHGGPAIDPLAVGVKPEARESPLRHQLGLQRFGGGSNDHGDQLS
jgi:hypothetical protein